MIQTVEAIKRIGDIKRLTNLMKGLRVSEYCLWLMGIYTGLRISDLLNLNVKDVKGKNILVIIERKTGKTRKIALNSVLMSIIKILTYGREDLEPLFLGVQGKRLTRGQFYRVLKYLLKRYQNQLICI